MSGKKTVKIFIASSAELKEERDRCVLQITELNKSHKHLHLEPVLWEYDTVKGNINSCENIQGAINPKLKECNIAIFMFYSKIGQYTEEEFELADAENKKLFVYFKKGFSPQKETFAAYGDLLNFKESLNDTVLYQEYENLTEFEKQLFPSLNLHLAEIYSPISNTTIDSAASQSVAILIQLLAAKEEEIKQLKEGNHLLAITANQEQLQELIKEKEALQQELLQTKEIQEQQARDKAVLEEQLSL